ncbi:MAG TPA: tetratricopeptide repeat protein [Anaerolineales bacterium]|nr:tetratricopeptide repeat protein [Anaerolineales bacterium]
MEQPPTRKIYLLGTFRIQDIHGTHTIGGEKAQGLLAYLTLHPTPHGRETLASLLFPEASLDRVRRNFSDTLYRVQKVLGNDWLSVEGETIALRTDIPIWVDVWEFDRLATSSDPADLQQALALYTGDLLPTCYDDWLIPARELRRNHFLFALENLAAHQEAAGQRQQALLTTRRILLAEPLHEPAHQTYLRLLGRLQRYAEALAHYDYLTDLFRTELDTTPTPETQHLVQALARERALAGSPLPSVEPTPFVGRVAERAAALDAVEAAMLGKGSLLALEGEAGMGKSRLLQEIITGARWRGATVLHSLASETPSASPFAPLASALAPWLNSPHAAPLEPLLGAEFLAALAPLLPTWPIPPSPSPTPQTLTNALRTFGGALGRFGPFVLILDDMQWGSPALWACLQTFAPPFVQNGNLLLLAYRRAEIENTPGWETLQKWDRTGLLKIIPLPPLTVAEVAELVPDAPAPEMLHALTGGNPFHLQTWQTEPREASALPLSPAQRFGELSLAARDALACAAVLGEDIPFRLWADMVAVSPLGLAPLSEELVARHWLQPSPSGFTFLHDLLRTAIYDEIPPAELPVLHTRAARAYQTLEPDNVRALAFHLDRAGLGEEAAGVYRRAGDQDLARLAFREAQTAYDRALTLLSPHPTQERTEILIALARANEVLGERVQAQTLLEEALRDAQQSRNKPLQLQASVALGRALILRYRYTDAEALLRKALVLARQLNTYTVEIEIFLLLGMNYTDRREPTEARKNYTKALKLARNSGEPTFEARALRGLGICARESGSPAESLKWLEEALGVHRRSGGRLGEVETLSNMVTAHYDLGAWDQVIRTAEEVLPKAEALENRYSIAYLRHLQGLAFLNLGEYAPARTLIRQARDDFEAAHASTVFSDATLGLIAEEDGNEAEAKHLYQTALARIEPSHANYERPVVQQDLGILFQRLEQPLEAIPLLEAARAAWVEQEDRLGQLKSGAYLGLAYLTIGDRTGAEACATTGWAIFREGLPIGEKMQKALWGLYQLFIGLEKQAEADAILDATYAELQRQARAIQEVERRRGFFTRVPLNRAIVFAYDQLHGVPRTQTVRLARREAPLGRALREDEWVELIWTIHAPEDEAFADKTDQRLHRLKRLLHEAEVCEAAPTDDDLAQALNVSRRTILRDMQALAEELPRPPTRKRK